MVCKSQVLEAKGLLYPLSIGDEVNFRLTYDGPLKAQSQSESRRRDKQLIRFAFHRQLTQLFHERGVDLISAEFRSAPIEPVKRGNLRCIALVREKLDLVCDLDILFLRRDKPGCLIAGGGDIDNRIKVLFDALRIPQDDNEVRDVSVTDGKNVVFCLTEDDKLITGFRITTDRLLEPPASESGQNDVRLIINVEVKATKLTPENLAYFSHF